MTYRLALLVVVGVSVAGCSSDTPAPVPTAPVESMAVLDTATALALTPAQRSERDAMAGESAAAFRTADGERRMSEACAEANAAAMFYGEAGRPADSTRWQATADSSCAAIEPEIERTLSRITDSLAAARGN